MFLVAGIPSREKPNDGHIETILNERDAIARYRKMITSGEYTFVYFADVMDAHPSGV